MIRIIFRKELAELLRTSRIGWLLFGTALLLLLAIYNGNHYARTHQQLIDTSQETTYQQFINQGNKNPHLGAHFGFYAYKPMPKLALIENGINDFTGNAFYLEPHTRGIVHYPEVNDATALRTFGFLNIGFFLQFILPLFIFLICHNIFSKEWENGTIKIILSTRVSIRQLFWGKLLACSFLTGIIIAILTLAPICLLAIQLPSAILLSLLPIYGCYILGVIVYSLLLLILSISISLWVRHSGLSLIILTSFWLLGVFLMPRLSAEMSRHIYPSTTAIEFDRNTFREKQYGVGKEGTKDARRAELEANTLKKYGVTRLQNLPVFFIPITIEYFEESDGKVMDRAYANIEANERQQDKFVIASSIFSPFLAFRDFSIHMTATDMRTHYDFADKAELHRRKVGEQVDAFYQKNTIASNDFWRQVPQFHYQMPGLAFRVNSALGAIAILCLWLIIAAIIMQLSIKKIRIQ